MQAASVEPETLSIEALFSAQDYMDQGLLDLSRVGVQGTVDSLRALVEPRSQRSGGMRMMSELGLGTARAFERDISASVCLFVCATERLPVIITSVSYSIEERLPNNVPILCTAKIEMTVIEVPNPFIFAAQMRQLATINMMRALPGLGSAAEYF